jgi:hypothetical protein
MSSNPVGFSAMAPEIKIAILSYLGSLRGLDCSSFRLVSKQFKDVVDASLQSRWTQLLNQALQTQPILAGLMQRVEKLTGSSPSVRFQKVTAEFAKLHAVLPGGKLPTTSDDFADLQNQVKNHTDHALVTIWPKICEALQMGMTSKTPDEIRNWFADPLNAAALNEITSLRVYGLNLGVFPDELTKLTQLVNLNLSGNQLTSVPESLGGLDVTEFQLANNPLMFIPDKVLHSDTFLISNNPVIVCFKNELAFPCALPLAILYQAIIKKKEEAEIKALFTTVPDEQKKLIFEMVWINAGRPETEDGQWGEHHVFDDMPRFYLSVRRAIPAQLVRLPEDRKREVYRNISRLASYRHSEDIYRLPDNPKHAEDEQWGQGHALDHLPRLADAISICELPLFQGLMPYIAHRDN